MFRKAVAIVALGFGLAGSAHANFTNPGFESGLSGWEADGEVNLVSSFNFGTDTILAPHGSWMAVLGSDVQNFNVLLQGLEASTQPLTLWYRFLGNAVADVSLDVQHATLASPDPATIFQQTLADTTFDTGWKTFSMSAGTTYVGFFHDSLGGNSNVLIDIAPVPEPDSYALLLAGLGIMGAVARRRTRAARV